MGEPVIISDGSPVKICWFGEGWTTDPSGTILTRTGGLQLDWILFNMVDKVDVTGQLQLKINFKLDSQNSGQTLLVTTDANRKNLSLQIANRPPNQSFADVFAPPRGAKGAARFQTSASASITGISVQLGGGQAQKKPTLKLLPTTVMLYEH